MRPERVATLVTSWVQFYTRDLPTGLARRRIDEIEADLHDHIAHERAQGMSDWRISLSVLARMVRGAADDLSWRGQHVQPTTHQPSAPEKPMYRSVVRVAVIAALILMVPFLAMQFDWRVPDPGSPGTEGVAWTLGDFVFAGVLIMGTGLLLELAAKKAPNTEYRAAVGIALAAGFILIWLTGAVGIIGSEDNAANLMYFGVLGVAIVGALIAGFRPGGMARTMLTTALAQASVGVIALIGGLGSTGPSWPWDVVGLTGFFTGLWLGSAWLFQRAAHERTPAGATPHG